MSTQTTCRGTFVLVGCGAAKADEKREARNLYTSAYFGLKRRYAEAATDWAGEHQSSAWAVLSAEHGVIPPRLEYEPYDTTVDDLDSEEVEQWADRVRSGLTSWLNWPFQSDNDPRESPCKRLVVLAGESYIQPLEEHGAFEGITGEMNGKPGLPAVPEFPFREHDFSGIGDQMSWLKERSQELEARGQPRREELSSFDAGYERDRARWQLDRPAIDLETTEQAGLDAFEEVPDCYIHKEQQSLENVAATDGGQKD